MRLTCFLGPLPVLGRVAMKVKCGNMQVDSSLVVVDCDGPLLCGRNTIQAFRNVGITLLEECEPDNWERGSLRRSHGETCGSIFGNFRREAYEKSALKPKTNNHYDVPLANGNYQIVSLTLA
ncbi:hypothetical protein MTO96_017908 [Rhipicephalus appendiculatus]